MKDPARTASFGGARVLLLESRLANETAAMVRRLGGEPVSAPALAEHDVDADDAVLSFIDRLTSAAAPAVVFLTGVAVNRLFAVAERRGGERALVEGLMGARIVARGPKPTGALGRRAVAPSCTVREPFTTSDVIDALEDIEVAACDVTVVHYGERNQPIVSHLEARRALVHELMLYEWRLPADIATLSRAVDALIAGEIPVLAFTSQVQVRHVFEVAGPSRRDALISALNHVVLVGAVGPTCAAACAAAGVRDVVAPAQPKLAPLLQSLAMTHAVRDARATGFTVTALKEGR